MTKIPTIHKKCAKRGCKTKVRLTPRDIRKNKKYCSRACANLCKVTTKYTPSTLQWIKDNINTLSKPEIAKHVGATVGALRRYLSKMRSEGHDIPKDPGHFAKVYAIGDTRISYSQGRTRTFLKISSSEWEETTPKKDRPEPKVKKARKYRNPKSREEAEAKSKLYVIPTPQSEGIICKTKVLIPGGGYIVCDSDKVDKVIKHLQKCG